MQGTLEGHTALVTGGTQGIGRAIAEALGRAGARVVLHGRARDRRAEEAIESLERMGRLAGFFPQDLAGPMPASADALAQGVLDAVPEVDLLVNNAGTYIDKPFLEMPFEIFERTWRLNVAAPFRIAQRLAQAWVASGTPGRMLFTGSINGRLAEPDHAAYDVSKGGVQMMVRTLCVALAPHRIRVNGIAPGLLRTPLTEPALADPKLDAWMRWHTPNGQVPEPDACAGAAVFLLSDAAEHIHGQMLGVDGGMSAWQQPDPPAGWSAECLGEGPETP